MKCKDWKTGYTSRFYKGLFSPEDQHGRKTMEMMKAAGLSCVELSCPYEEMEQIGFLSDPNKIKALSEETGIELWSVHLPYGALDHRYEVQHFWRLLEVINASKKAGFKVLTLHPSYEDIPTAKREAKLEETIVNLKIISDYCNGVGITLAIEDLPRTCLGHNSEEMLRMLDACPDVKVTFDTNHILTSNKDDNLSFIKNVGKKIISTHVSDYDLIDEKHWLPLDGLNDWKGIVKALEDVGYEGPFLYETFWDKRKDPEKGPVTPEMLRENHMRIAQLTEE